jgi:hypothetical protein
MKNKNQELMNSQKVEIPKNSSFRQKPESSYFKLFWTPAFAGVTTQETFYEIIKFISAFSARYIFSVAALPRCALCGEKKLTDMESR